MPVPKRKTSKARRNNRNANKNIAVKTFIDCKNCNEVTLPHQVCKNCGFYKGEKVLETKLDRAMRRGDSRKKLQDAKAAAAASAAPVEVDEKVVEAVPVEAEKPAKTKKAAKDKK